MQVLHVCSEMFPLLKTGGLADVIGALPAAQIADGVDVRVLLPGFPDIRRGIPDAHVVSRRDTFAGKISLLFGHYNGVGIYLIDAPHLYERPGSPYHDTNLYAYTDNVLRFALLGWVGCEMACGLDPFWRPDVVHAHDWHAGLAPAYLAARGRPAKSVFTVHNLAYQGMFYAKHMDDIELPWSFFNMHGLEFNGQLSFLKAGLYYADHITAVSPTYAREITEPQFAYGMEGLLRQRHLEGRLSGILNGVDEKIWNPESDLLLEALPGLLEQGGQLALLGAGDPVLQEGFLAAAAEHPGQVGVQIGYHEAFSHRIMGGADVILVPSRFEPCGLTQLYGLKYGTLPLVRRTGGLADTVSDSSLENLADGIASGFVFEDSNAWSLLRAIRRAFVLWSRPSLWRFVQRQAMAMDFSWQVAAKSYRELYYRLK
ncbi:glycogen synthase [Salmonella enterica]|nr:glycogen synthase [Salmonella enterica]